MKKRAVKLANAFALLALCLTFFLCVSACGGKTKPSDQTDPVPPEKVSDGIDFEVATEKSKYISVADYITVNDYTASAESDSSNATAAVSEGLLTVTGVSEGTATVTLSCGDIEVTFGVTVYAEYKVTVDGVATEVRKGETFVLPTAPTIADVNFEFDYWLVGEEHKNPHDTITVNGNVTVTSVTKRKAAVKVKDGEPVSTPLGRVKKLDVADYITAYGAEVTAESDDRDTVAVTVEDGKIVFTPATEGTATVTVKCGTVEIEFAVTVTTDPLASYTITVDGRIVATVNEGDTYTLPAAVESSDPDFEFVGWEIVGVDGVKQSGDEITVENNVEITAKFERKPVEKIKDGVTLNITADGSVTSASIDVTEYIDKHGSAATVNAASQAESTVTVALNGNTLTITAVAAGNTTVTLTCGDVTVTFTVNVTSVADGTPVFDNGAISFDLFEKTSDTYTITEPAVSGYNYTYSYSTTDTNVVVSGNTLTYTASSPMNGHSVTVDVTATDAAQNITKTTSFTVTVTVTDTTPVASDSVVNDSTVHDLYDGELRLDLTSNIDNPASHSGTYKVNGADVSDPAAYNVTGGYTDTATDVALSVVATFGTKTVTYTYNVKVIDSTAYRLINGGFENDLDGWTIDGGNIGAVNNATMYWNEMKPFESVGKFFNAYTVLKEDDANVALGGDEGAKGTLTSSTFTIGGSGWITYMLGGAKETTLVYLEIVDAATQEVLDRFGNKLFSDADLGGCKLIKYKADLSAHKGKTAFIRITDNASANYGLFFADEFVTYYAAQPDNTFNTATSLAHLKYQVANCGFENGNLDGWTLNGDIGVVSSDSSYWTHTASPPSYNKDGDKLFTWWTWENDHEVSREGNTGTLTSDEFILKAGQTISFKFGGGGGNNEIYIEVVDVETGNAIAKFFNTEANGGELKQYHYTFDTTDDKACYIRIVDNATSSWGCLAVDSFITYGDVVTTGTQAVNQLTV